MLTSKFTTTLSEAQHIYVGIDVHLKQYQVQILGEDHNTGPSFSQEASPSVLVKHLQKNYPGAAVHCVYEAGFAGFTLCRALKQAGHDCLVVHPADVPSTDKEKRTKTDRVDARKLALQLRSNALSGIYIPNEYAVSLRNLIRVRKRMVWKRTSCKNQIQHFLFFNGIQRPKELSGWSKKSINWLRELPLSYCDRVTLDSFLQLLDAHQVIIKDVDRKLVQLRNEAQVKKPVDLLRSVPGVGLNNALVLLSEIGDMHRFKHESHLFSYVGLIPHVQASGDSEYVGGLTIRGNRWIKDVIIESAWQAVHKDPALFNAYGRYKKRMNGNKAIVRIAKKLLSRIRRVLLTGEPYQMGVN